jgi:hypothetical protein
MTPIECLALDQKANGHDVSGLDFAKLVRRIRLVDDFLLLPVSGSEESHERWVQYARILVSEALPKLEESEEYRSSGENSELALLYNETLEILTVGPRGNSGENLMTIGGDASTASPIVFPSRFGTPSGGQDSSASGSAIGSSGNSGGGASVSSVSGGGGSEAMQAAPSMFAPQQK